MAAIAVIIGKRVQGFPSKVRLSWEPGYWRIIFSKPAFGDEKVQANDHADQEVVDVYPHIKRKTLACARFPHHDPGGAAYATQTTTLGA